MENNLVELKLDRIDNYFEKFKTKYKSHYELNKTNKTHLVIPYQKLIMPTLFGFIGMITFLMTRIMYSQISDNTAIPNFSQAVMLLTNILSIALLIAFSFFIVISLIDFFKNIHNETIEYTAKEYYNKIKDIMIKEIQSELSNLISEDMLTFDSDGLITSPNLSTNENIKTFKQIERELKLNEQQSN